MTIDAQLSESATTQGRLWGERARDWAEFQEPVILPADRRVDVALRALKSAGPIARIIEAAGEAAVDDALKSCLADYRLSDGTYLFQNRFRALTARA